MLPMIGLVLSAIFDNSAAQSWGKKTTDGLPDIPSDNFKIQLDISRRNDYLEAMNL